MDMAVVLSDTLQEVVIHQEDTDITHLNMFITDHRAVMAMATLEAIQEAVMEISEVTQLAAMEILEVTQLEVMETLGVTQPEVTVTLGAIRQEAMEISEVMHQEVTSEAIQEEVMDTELALE